MGVSGWRMGSNAPLPSKTIGEHAAQYKDRSNKQSEQLKNNW